MKIEIDYIPEKKYKIERNGERAIISFFENAEEIIFSDGRRSVLCDEYTFSTKYRMGLEENIASNLEIWLSAAKKSEYDIYAAEVRKRRNELLCECDWTQNADVPLAEYERMLWKKYRQALRDISSQSGFPYNVVFPKRPI